MGHSNQDQFLQCQPYSYLIDSAITSTYLLLTKVNGLSYELTKFIVELCMCAASRIIAMYTMTDSSFHTDSSFRNRNTCSYSQEKHISEWNIGRKRFWHILLLLIYVVSFKHFIARMELLRAISRIIH